MTLANNVPSRLLSFPGSHGCQSSLVVEAQMDAIYVVQADFAASLETLRDLAQVLAKGPSCSSRSDSCSSRVVSASHPLSLCTDL